MQADGPALCLESDMKDGYGNSFSRGAKVVQGHFLEKVPRKERIYYLDTKKAIVNAACVRGISPTLLTINTKVRGRLQKAYEVTVEMHEILSLVQ